jgi:hypothetical protein
MPSRKRTAVMPAKLFVPPRPMVMAPQENMRKLIQREGRSFFRRMLLGTSKRK